MAYEHAREYLLRHIPSGERDPDQIDSLTQSLLPCIQRHVENGPLYALVDLTAYHIITRLRLRSAICDLFPGRYAFFPLSSERTDFFSVEWFFRHLTSECGSIILELEGLRPFHYATQSLLDGLRENSPDLWMEVALLHRLEGFVILILLT
jgi:hypothetical protein